MTRQFAGDVAEASAYAAALVGQSLPATLAGAVPAPLQIVDVGALDIEQPEIYEALSLYHPCKVIGFEPQSPEITTRSAWRMVRTVLPRAVGDGAPARFHRTRFPAASSLRQPDQEFLKVFHALPEMLTVEDTVVIDTARLDDVAEIDGCDLLKLDVQGGELDVLRHATRLLQDTVMVVTEVEFAPLYKGQPLFADVDVFLRGCGFELHDFLTLGNGAYRAGPFGDHKGRLIWADAVYVKTDQEMRALGPDKILKAFLLGHYLLCNGGYAAHLLSLHDELMNGALLDAYTPMLHHAHYCAMRALGKTPPKLG